MLRISVQAIFLVAATVSGLVANHVVVANPRLAGHSSKIGRRNKNQTNPLMHAIYDANVDASGNGGRRQLVGGNVLNAADMDAALHLLWKEDGERLLVEVTSTTEAADMSLRRHLEEYGFESTGCTKYTCSGYLDIALLPEVEQLPSVKSIMPSMTVTSGSLRGEHYHHRKTEEIPSNESRFGSVKNHAFEALQVDKLQAAYPHLTGTGMKIGILSDSYDSRGEANFDVASGDLPSDVVVVKESSVRQKDEGRAMVQLIYDLAPDAKFYFHSMEGVGDIVDGINALADAGCDIIVDDVGKSKLVCVCVCWL